MEFSVEDTILFYTISIDSSLVLDEYLARAESIDDERMIFHRTYSGEKTSIEFFKGFGENSKNKALEKVVENDLLKSNYTLINLLNTITNDSFFEIKPAYPWFNNNLQIVYPNRIANGLVLQFEQNKTLKDFANSLMCSFPYWNIESKVDAKSVEVFFGKDNPKVESIMAAFTTNPNRKYVLIADQSTNEDVAIIQENGNGEATN
jgi:hypothetical protein